MAYFLSQLVILIHLLFIIYVVFGGLLNYRWPRNIWIHIPAFLYGIMVELFAWICPLTYLENWLSELAGQEKYETGFIEEYIVPIIYPVGFDLSMQLIFTFIVVILNLAIYAPLILSKFRKRV